MKNGVFINSKCNSKALSGDFKAKKIIDMVKSGENQRPDKPDCGF